MKKYQQIKFKIAEEEKTFKPPESVVNQAKRALKYKNKYKDEVSDAGTRVGWERANQLANKENLSIDTIKRMYSFFSRHKGNEKVDSKYKNELWKDNGFLMHLAWGGDAGFEWVKNIIDEIEK